MMKILTDTNDPYFAKDPLPKGKISCRFVSSRCVYQFYVGGKFLVGASGETIEEAMEWAEISYDCPEDWKESVTFL